MTRLNLHWNANEVKWYVKNETKFNKFSNSTDVIRIINIPYTDSNTLKFKDTTVDLPESIRVNSR